MASRELIRVVMFFKKGLNFTNSLVLQVKMKSFHRKLIFEKFSRKIGRMSFELEEEKTGFMSNNNFKGTFSVQEDFPHRSASTCAIFRWKLFMKFQAVKKCFCSEREIPT